MTRSCSNGSVSGADPDVIAPAGTLVLPCLFPRSTDPLWAAAREAAAPGLLCSLDFYE